MKASSHQGGNNMNGAEHDYGRRTDAFVELLRIPLPLQIALVLIHMKVIKAMILKA